MSSSPTIPGTHAAIPGSPAVIPSLLAGSLIWLESVDSTNSYAIRRLEELPSGTVIAAREQTAGRGQRGNTWFTEPGKNLTFSIVLKDIALPASDAHLLNYIASVAVAQFIDSYGVKCYVKWPNDIYVGKKKICGILVENSLAGSNVFASVIGIGININQTRFHQLANATSLSCITGKDYSPEKCLEQFLNIFSALMPQLQAPSLVDAYSSRLFQKDNAARYHDLISDAEYTGIIRGVLPDGRLHIFNSDSGQDLYYKFKEVSYIL